MESHKGDSLEIVDKVDSILKNVPKLIRSHRLRILSGQ